MQPAPGGERHRVAPSPAWSVLSTASARRAPIPRRRHAARNRQVVMTTRTRKLVGTILLLAFLVLYALAAMLAAVVLQVRASPFVELVYYVVAGLAWVVPAGLLIRWMARPEP
jgi:hypothetical protein